MFESGDKVRVLNFEEREEADKKLGTSRPGYKTTMELLDDKICTIISGHYNRGYEKYVYTLKEGGVYGWREDWLENEVTNFFSEKDFTI